MSKDERANETAEQAEATMEEPATPAAGDAPAAETARPSRR